MNSQEIQWHLPESYQQFFTEHEKVISLPLSINWIGSSHPNYKGLSIKQKLPLRIFCGLRKRASKWVPSTLLGQIITYEIGEKKFITKNTVEYLPYGHDLQHQIDLYYKQYAISWSYTLDIMAETSRSLGIGFDQVVIANIVAILYQLHTPLSVHTLHKRKDIALNELLHNKVFGLSPLYDHITQWIYKLQWFSQQDDYVTSALFDTPYPTVSFRNEKSTHGICKIFAYRMQELVWSLPAHPHAPIDFWLIYSGKPVVLEQNVGHLQTNAKYKSKLIELFKGWFERDIMPELPIDRPFFYQHFFESGSQFGWLLDYMLGLASISMELLYSTYKIYTKGYDEDDIRYFIQTINKARSATTISKKSSSALQDLISIVYQTIGANLIGKIGLSFNDSNISWGCLVFAMPYEGFRHAIKKVQGAIHEQDEWGTIIYSNRIDGVWYDGLRIDQDTSQWVFSSYIQHKAYILQSSHYDTHTSSYSTLLQDTRHDILCDTITMKITIAGVPLSSKELHSQSATIELLRYLLDHQNQSISCKDLPPSSYSKLKNELQGKIIWPLQQVLMSYLEKKLPLTITGSWSNFFIKLDSSSLKIGFVEAWYREE